MKRLSKNLLLAFSADIARRLLGFISVAYLARVLGTEGFGAINLGFAVLAYRHGLSAAGFLRSHQENCAGRAAGIDRSVIGSRLIATMIMLLVVAFAVLTAVQNATIAWLIILFSCAVLPQIFFVDWFFQGKELWDCQCGKSDAGGCLSCCRSRFCPKINDIMW